MGWVGTLCPDNKLQVKPEGLELFPSVLHVPLCLESGHTVMLSVWPWPRWGLHGSL